MTITARNLMFRNKYFVCVKKHRKAKNVLLARYPKNIFVQPPLKEEVFQYYLDEDEILVTNLSSKETKKIQTNMLERRILILCDIFARATKRNIQPDLIITNNKSVKLLNLIEIPKYLKSEEKLLLKVLSSAIKKSNEFEKKYQNSYDKFVEILDNGGIL